MGQLEEDSNRVASRIEGMTRSYPVEILVSDATREAINSQVELYRIATVQVKNRVEPLTFWSPDPPREKPDMKNETALLSTEVKSSAISDSD